MNGRASSRRVHDEFTEGSHALYRAAILKTWIRATLIAGLLGAGYSVRFVVLRRDDYALLAGTGALFAALAAVMFFTRNIEGQAEDAPSAPTATPEGAR